MRPRSRIRDRTVPGPLARIQGQDADLLPRPLTDGRAVAPPRRIGQVLCSMNTWHTQYKTSLCRGGLSR